jgi:hypothetical protein
MRPSNPPRNVASFKNAESVATAPQLRAAACDGALSASHGGSQSGLYLKMFGLRRWRLPFALVGATSARPERSTLQRVSGNPPGMERGLPRTSNVAGPLSWHRTPPVSCARFASLNQQYSKLRQYAAISGELANLARRAQSVA